MKSKAAPVFRVTSRSRSATHGHITVGNLTFRCALGRAGMRTRKREGDGATPVGIWRFCSIYFRRDHIHRPHSGLPVLPIRRHDGWCDAPADRNYNRRVDLPYPASAETLWRDDTLYDLIVVLDHNTQPRRRGGGSAIFIHVARAGLMPTEGCIALPLPHLRRLVANARAGSRLLIN